MKIQGGCHCGGITYEAEIDLENVRIRHCTDCGAQTWTRSAQPWLGSVASLPAKDVQ